MKSIRLLMITVLSMLVACAPTTLREAPQDEASALLSVTHSPVPVPTEEPVDSAGVSPIVTPTAGQIDTSPDSTVATPTREVTATSPDLSTIEPLEEPTGMVENMEKQTPLPGTEVLITKAKEMLTQLPNFDFTADEILPVLVEVRQWRDSSLGCPREGMMYAQVITPGYIIVLQAGDQLYEFHTDTRDGVVLCFINGEDAVEVLRP